MKKLLGLLVALGLAVSPVIGMAQQENPADQGKAGQQTEVKKPAKKVKKHRKHKKVKKAKTAQETGAQETKAQGTK